MESRKTTPIKNKNRIKLYYWLGYLLVLILCTFTAVYLPVTFIQIFLGLIISIFLPGYLFISALWPRKDELGLLWRLGLILPSGLALVTGILLLINYFGVYHYQPTILFMGLLDCILLAIFAWRSTQVLNGSPILVQYQKRKRFQWGWKYTLPGMAILFLVFSIIYVVMTPPKQLHITEFYVMTVDNRLVTNYSREELLRQGIKIGVTNHEGKPSSYSVFITAQVFSEETMLGFLDYSLTDGSNQEKIFTIANLPDQANKINIYLYLLPGSQNTYPYRTLSVQISPLATPTK